MMNAIYKEFSFSPITNDQSDALVAMLSSIDFDGFELLKDRLNAYVPITAYNEDALEQVLSHFTDLSYTSSEIPEQNWNAIWESSFEPVIVKNFVAVRASFHPAQPQVKFDLIITPKMSFGTGHHATTALVMELMEEIDFKNKTIVDFGTGTGVLAILAEKLGAKNILAIDNDKWSIENAAENFELNDARSINLLNTGSLADVEPMQIVMANINLNVLKINMPHFCRILKPKGEIIFSGLLVNDKEVFIKLINDNCFIVNKVIERDGWIAIWASFATC